VGHRRTPKRKRKNVRAITATFWSAAVFCRFGQRLKKLPIVSETGHVSRFLKFREQFPHGFCLARQNQGRPDIG